MNSDLLKHTGSWVAAIALTVLLGGCASNTEVGAADSEMTATAPQFRCPAGYMMTCEAKKVGRIRFGRIGKENTEYCSCEPEMSTSSTIMNMPKIPN